MCSTIDNNLWITYKHDSDPEKTEFQFHEDLIKVLKQLKDKKNTVFATCFCKEFKQYNTTTEKIIENFKSKLEAVLKEKTDKALNILAIPAGSYEGTQTIGVTCEIPKMDISIMLKEDVTH